MNKDIVFYRLQRAKETFEDAKILFAKNRLNSTVNWEKEDVGTIGNLQVCLEKEWLFESFDFSRWTWNKIAATDTYYRQAVDSGGQ